MAPLITLLAVTLLLRAAGAAGIRPLRSWHTSLRGGLAAMFTLTGTAHFNGMREDLIAMVPPSLPYPGLLVTLTGVLELLAAAGLLHRRTAPWAAGGLTLLLVAMFPANVHAALAGLMVNGEPATALLPRTLMQLVFAAATVIVMLPYIRALPRRRSAATRSEPAAEQRPEDRPEDEGSGHKAFLGSGELQPALAPGSVMNGRAPLITPVS